MLGGTFREGEETTCRKKYPINFIKLIAIHVKEDRLSSLGNAQTLNFYFPE